MTRLPLGLVEAGLPWVKGLGVTCRAAVHIGVGRKMSEKSSSELHKLYQNAGLPVVGEIRAPGYLEGGDFFPAGRDLALVGIGLRSNLEAARQLMDGDLLGTSRLAVVRDDFEQHQVGGCRVKRVLG